MDHKEKARAKLLNEAQALLYSSHHKMRWLNFKKPYTGDLAKVKGQLEEALSMIQKVIDDDVFPTNPWLG